MPDPLFKGGGRPPFCEAGGDLAEFGAASGTADQYSGNAADHGAAGEHGVARLVQILGGRRQISRVLFHRVGFARQHCLIDEEVPCLDEAPIGGNEVSRT